MLHNHKLVKKIYLPQWILFYFKFMSLDQFNKYLVLMNPNFDPVKTPFDLTVFELVNKLEHFSFSVLSKKGFKRGSCIEFLFFFYIYDVNEKGQNIKLGVDNNLPFTIKFKIHKRQIVQKFRNDQFKKGLFNIIADKHPNKKIFWNTKLNLYFIKYDIKR